MAKKTTKSAPMIQVRIIRDSKKETSTINHATQSKEEAIAFIEKYV